MKPTIYRRIRRRTASHDAPTAKKDNQQELSFFGEAAHETFFQPAPAIQRKCADCDKAEKVHRVADKKEEDKVMKKEDKKEDEKLHRSAEKKEDEKLQKKEVTNSPTSGTNVSSYINSLNGKGNRLSSKANQFFSARMGYDFSNVKVHTDKEASESAKAVNAKAYTVGNNVVFNEGEHNEESGEGKKLMAHELTHVVQQHDDCIYRQRVSEEPPITDVIEKPAEEHLPDQPEGEQGVYTCNPVGLDRKTFLSKPNTQKFPFGITGPLNVRMQTINLVKGKRGKILEPTESFLQPVPSFYTQQSDFIEGKRHFLGDSPCHPGITAKTYPIHWVIQADGEAQIKKAELEHCEDIKYAFDLTLGKYTDYINAFAKAKTPFKNLTACKSALKKKTKVEPDLWLDKFETTAKKTELRDPDWHLPKPFKTLPDKIKDPLHWCDYFEDTISKNSLKEVGKHPSSDIIK